MWIRDNSQARPGVLPSGIGDRETLRGLFREIKL
jgi:hypothetical protein